MTNERFIFGRIHLIAISLSSRVNIVYMLNTAVMNKAIVTSGIKRIHNVVYLNLVSLFLNDSSIILAKVYNYVLLFFKVLKFLFFVIDRKDLVVMFPATDLRLLYLLFLKFKGVRVICEINEYPLAAKDNGFCACTKRFIIFKTFKLYSGFIVISENLNNLINKYKSRKSLVFKLPVISIKPNLNKSENKTIKPCEFDYIFHAGSLLESKDNISDMLRAFGLARRNLNLKVKFILTGLLENSSDPFLLKKIINEFKMEEDIIFTGFLSYQELTAYMTHAKLAIVLKKDNLQNNYCFATKLSEYFSYRIPVITTLIGENKNFIVDNINAFVVASNSPELVSQSIIFAFENEIISKKIGMGGYKTFIKNFDLLSNKQSLNHWVNINYLLSQKN